MIGREATKRDVRACAKIEKQESGESIEIIEDEIEEQVDDENHFIFVAEDDKRVVGFISSEWQKWNSSLYIDSLYIDKNYRFKGYGSNLLKQMIRKTKKITESKNFLDFHIHPEYCRNIIKLK